MYEKYQTDPNQIPEDWKIFFSGLSKNLNEQNILRASWANNDFATEEDLAININSSWEKKSYKINENISTNISSDKLKEQIYDSIRAIRLIRAFRVNGHLASQLDPLNLKEIKNYPELDYRNYGFEEKDLSKEIFIDGSLGLNFTTLNEIINILKETYCGSIGVEFVHIQDADQKQWVQERIEEVRNKTQFTTNGKKAIFKRLLEAEMFEKFLDKKFIGTKRFGLVGSEATIPGIEQIIKQSCLSGIEDIYIGTAHRGRLTLLSSVMEVPLRSIMAKFEGGGEDPNEILGSGDVKYHLGISSDREFEDKKIHLSLTPNPSHLEAVDPCLLYTSDAADE